MSVIEAGAPDASPGFPIGLGREAGEAVDESQDRAGQVAYTGGSGAEPGGDGQMESKRRIGRTARIGQRNYNI